MHWIDAFTDEVTKLAKAGGAVALHKDHKEPKVIDVKGRVADKQQRAQIKSNDRKMRWRARGAAMRRGLMRGKGFATQSGVKKDLMTAGVAVGSALLGKKKRDLQRRHDDLDTGSSKSRKNYTPSTAARAAQIGGTLYAARHGGAALLQKGMQETYRHAYQRAGSPLDKKQDAGMSKAIKGRVQRAAAGAGLVAGATIVDRIREKRRRAKFQDSLKKSAEKKDEGKFRVNKLRATGRALVDGVGAGLPAVAFGRYVANTAPASRQPAVRKAFNTIGGAFGLGGAAKGLSKSVENQREEFILKRRIKNLEKAHGLKND